MTKDRLEIYRPEMREWHTLASGELVSGPDSVRHYRFATLHQADGTEITVTWGEHQIVRVVRLP